VTLGINEIKVNMLQSLDHTCYVYNNTTKTQIALLIKNIDGGVGYR